MNKEEQNLWEKSTKHIILHKEAFVLLHDLEKSDAREVALEALRTSAKNVGNKRYSILINSYKKKPF